MTSSETIIGGIPIQIIKKNNLKNLYVRINPPEGRVVVSSPSSFPDEEIKLFVLKKIPEITKVRDRMLSQARQSEREYVSGESHYLWGKPYRLQVIKEGNRYQVTRMPNKIIFKVPKRSTKESRERAFNEWYREELKRALDGVVIRYEAKTNLQANEYRIKNMKTKWGTCNIEKKRIWINLELAKKPIHCLEYIIVHEMIHFIERHHNDRFMALMDKYIPQWKFFKEELNRLPVSHGEWDY